MQCYNMHIIELYATANPNPIIKANINVQVKPIFQNPLTD